MNMPIPEQKITPEEGKYGDWPEYRMQEAKENALRSLFKDSNRPYGRDLARDYVDNADYKDHCEFFNIVVSMITAETDSKIKQAHKAMFDWFMDKCEKPVNTIAETKLIEEDRDRFDEYED